MIVYQNQLWFLSPSRPSASTNYEDGEPQVCILGVQDIREVLYNAVRMGDRVAAIKYVRTQTGCTLKYAADVVDYIKEKIGVEEITEYRIYTK